MAAVILPHRSALPPAGPVRINWGSSLTRGLVFAQYGLNRRDLVNGSLPTNYAPSSIVATRRGIEYYFGGGAGPEITWPSPIASGDMSLAVVATPYAAVASKVPLGVYRNGAAVGNYISVESGPVYSAVSTASGDWVIANSTIAPAAGTTVRLGFSFYAASATAWGLFINGRSASSRSASRNPVNLDVVRLSGYSTTGNSWIGALSAPMVWNRALTASEWAAYHENPWQVFGRDPGRVYFFPSAGGSSYNVDIAESASAADTLSSVAILAASVSEAASAADACSSVATLLASVAEALTATDAATSSATLAAAIAETLATADVFAALGAPMFLRPDGNVTQSNVTGGYAEIDESSASDADFAYGAENTIATLEVSLSDPSGTPGSGTCTVRYRIAKLNDTTPDGGGTTVTCTAYVYQGATEIAADTSRTATGSWTEYSFTFDASAVSDWSDLRLRFTSPASGGNATTRRAIGISWAELEAPASSGNSYSATIEEAATTADTVATALTLVASVTDAASAADQVASTATLAAQVSEAANAADAVSGLLQAIASVAESVSLADLYSTSGQTYSLDVSESVSLADAIAAALSAQAGVVESVSATDAIASVATLLATLTETVTAADQVSSGLSGSTYSVNIAEAASLLDAVSANLAAIGQLSEAVNAADSTASSAVLAAAVAEALAALDSATAVGVFGVTISEGVTATDSVSAPTGFGETPASRTITVQRGGRTITVRLHGRTINVH